MSAECDRVGDKIPYVPENGRYTTDWGEKDIFWWTNGFWGGMLWQMYHATGDENCLLYTSNEVDLAFSLGKLSQMLDSYYGIAPVIIIDEYDTPIQNGFMKGYYNQIVSFMCNLFSGAYKDNRHLSYGFLTGILRVAKEGIFSGLNNLSVDSVLDVRYSRYFGFTQDEV